MKTLTQNLIELDIFFFTLFSNCPCQNQDVSSLLTPQYLMGSVMYSPQLSHPLLITMTLTWVRRNSLLRIQVNPKLKKQVCVTKINYI